MKPLPILVTFLIGAMPAFAEQSRQLDAHEHGVGQLDIAFDGNRIAMQFHAPGADMVGFEHAAKSAEDRTAVDTAVAMLARPLDLFVLPYAAGCSVVQARAELESEDDHEAAEHGHEDHTDKAGHTEFHAEYLLNCADPGAVTSIEFAYFEAFPNAQEVEVQLVSQLGATAFDVRLDAPVLDLRDMF